MHCFIVNRRARRGRADRLAAELERALEPYGLEYRIVLTEGPGNATEQTRHAVSAGADAVVAAGGDGTINEVLNGLDDKTPLGILPLGTCNDIAHNLGLPEHDWREALTCVAAGRVVQVDVARCNDRRYLSVVGAGMDARVAVAFKRLPGLLQRPATHAALVFKHVLTRRPLDFRLTIDGEVVERHAWMVAVANTERYGGGMKIAPEARRDDGMLHVCIVGDAPRLEVIRSLPLVYRGKHTDHPFVSMFKARKVEIECAQSTPFIIDGEPVGSLPATLSIEPASLSVFGSKDTTSGSSTGRMAMSEAAPCRSPRGECEKPHRTQEEATDGQ